LLGFWKEKQQKQTSLPPALPSTPFLVLLSINPSNNQTIKPLPTKINQEDYCWPAVYQSLKEDQSNDYSIV
jgi:hypothetical protein